MDLYFVEISITIDQSITKEVWVDCGPSQKNKHPHIIEHPLIYMSLHMRVELN